MAETFRIIDEPLSFQDKAFIAVATNLVRSIKTNKGREITCDIQAAWDLAGAMASWREKMKKGANE